MVAIPECEALHEDVDTAIMQWWKENSLFLYREFPCFFLVFLVYHIQMHALFNAYLFNKVCIMC